MAVSKTGCREAEAAHRERCSVSLVFVLLLLKLSFIFQGDGAKITDKRLSWIFLRVGLALDPKSDHHPPRLSSGRMVFTKCSVFCLQLPNFKVSHPDFFQVTIAVSREKDDYLGWQSLHASFTEINELNEEFLKGKSGVGNLHFSHPQTAQTSTLI